MRRRRIAVVTTTRAEYGLLRSIVSALAADPRATLQLVVGGAHLDRRAGSTARQIEADGVPIAARVPFAPTGDSGADVARAAARALEGFARAFARLDPDIVLVLGDRYEILAAVIAAAAEGRVVAHLHGGEVTAGSLDEGWRHAITKIAHIHLPATAEFAARIRQMGEASWRIRVVGAPGVESVHRARRRPLAELEAILGRAIARPLAICTYHPVTNEAGATAREIDALLSALARSRLGTVVFTAPNADAGGQNVRRRLVAAAHRRPGWLFVPSLGTAYHELLRHADLMVGNSSSGLIEAPAFGLPVVNIGVRQDGRPRAAHVIDARGDPDAISKAIGRALSPRFRRRLAALRSPYAARRTSARVRDVLLTIALDSRLRRKRFADR